MAKQFVNNRCFILEKHKCTTHLNRGNDEPYLTLIKLMKLNHIIFDNKSLMPMMMRLKKMYDFFNELLQ